MCLSETFDFSLCSASSVRKDVSLALDLKVLCEINGQGGDILAVAED